jgi:hypothetical protein
MKGQIKLGLKVATLLVASVAFGSAQTSSMSAPGARPQNPNTYNQNTYQSRQQAAPVGPGAINYVEGQASLNGQSLAPGSVGTATLRPGQTLDTGNGYVEMLLTPGAFLRVGNNSQVQIISAGLADTKVQLNRGTSMIEVDQLVKGAHLAVTMNGATSEIEKKGLYEFDSSQQAIRVFKGTARVTEAARTQKLESGNQVLLTGNQPLKRHDIDEKTLKTEPLYVWSKTRSEDESQASAMAASNAGAYAMAGPGWFWDPAWNFYGFWPLEAELYSPFGWGFYSPAFFGFYGGYGLGFGYGYPAYWYGHPGFGTHIVRPGISTRVNGFRGASSFRTPAAGGFHGGGFHSGSMGGGFHGGGGFGGGRR